MQVADLPVLPGPPRAELKRQILEEFLQNPFLDDDLAGLSLRLQASRFELGRALGELCQAHFLKEAGRSRYALDLDFAADEEGIAEPVLPAGEEKVLSLPAEALVAQHIGTDAAGELAAADLVDALPYGAILLRADGSLILANQRAVDWLGIPLADLDAERFAQVTGFQPSLVLGNSPTVHFSLKDPRALEVSMHACRPADEPAILVVLRDSSLQEEIARAQTSLHEELFARLDQDLVEPLLAIQHFLENPDADELGQARLALEQINGFLQDFLLVGKPFSQAE